MHTGCLSAAPQRFVTVQTAFAPSPASKYRSALILSSALTLVQPPCASSFHSLLCSGGSSDRYSGVRFTLSLEGRLACTERSECDAAFSRLEACFGLPCLVIPPALTTAEGSPVSRILWEWRRGICFLHSSASLDFGVAPPLEGA